MNTLELTATRVAQVDLVEHVQLQPFEARELVLCFRPRPGGDFAPTETRQKRLAEELEAAEADVVRHLQQRRGPRWQNGLRSWHRGNLQDLSCRALLLLHFPDPRCVRCQSWQTLHFFVPLQWHTLLSQISTELTEVSESAE